MPIIGDEGGANDNPYAGSIVPGVYGQPYAEAVPTPPPVTPVISGRSVQNSVSKSSAAAAAKRAAQQRADQQALDARRQQEEAAAAAVLQQQQADAAAAQAAQVQQLKGSATQAAAREAENTYLDQAKSTYGGQMNSMGYSQTQSVNKYAQENNAPLKAAAADAHDAMISAATEGPSGSAIAQRNYIDQLNKAGAQGGQAGYTSSGQAQEGDYTGPSFAPKAAAGTGAPTVTTTHTVTSSDTLSGIAAKNGTTVEAIAKLNNISNPNLIRDGAVLQIPVGGKGAGGIGAASDTSGGIGAVGAVGATGGQGAGTNNGGGATGAVTTHVVTSSDTLSGLAAKHGTTVAAIAQLNGIKNPDLIIDGTTLKIPTGGQGAGASSSTSSQDASQFALPGTGGTHVVQSGDTLSELAVKYGTTVDALAKLNNIKNPDLIYTGSTLKLPEGGKGAGGGMTGGDPSNASAAAPVVGMPPAPSAGYP